MASTTKTLAEAQFVIFKHTAQFTLHQKTCAPCDDYNTTTRPELGLLRHDPIGTTQLGWI